MTTPNYSSNSATVRLRKVQEKIANLVLDQRTTLGRLAVLKLQIRDLRDTEAALLRALGSNGDRE